MKLFRQTDGFSCVPRSLQTAMSHFGVYPGYKEIKRLCETDPSGTSVDKVEEAAQYYGFTTFVYEEDATTDLIKEYTDLDYPVIVFWWVGQSDNHVSVAYSCDDERIYLMDPSLNLYLEPYVTMKRCMLEKCWRKHPDSKWMMAIDLEE